MQKMREKIYKKKAIVGPRFAQSRAIAAPEIWHEEAGKEASKEKCKEGCSVLMWHLWESISAKDQSCRSQEESSQWWLQLHMQQMLSNIQQKVDFAGPHEESYRGVKIILKFIKNFKIVTICGYGIFSIVFNHD